VFSIGTTPYLASPRVTALTQFQDVGDNPDSVVGEFRRRFYETGLLGDRYAGNKFAEYLFKRHDAPPQEHNYDQAHRIVEEAQLFIEATYACHDSLAERRAGGFDTPGQFGKAAGNS
jgi:hypothetical protein